MGSRLAGDAREAYKAEARVMTPGRTLHRVAAAVCSTKTLQRVIEPAIADLQKEYASARAGIVPRIWALIRGYTAILKVVAICAVSASISTGAERRSLISMLYWSAGMVVAAAAVLLLPALYGHSDARLGWYAVSTLVPQAVPLAIPIRIAFGIAFGLSARPNISIAKVILIGAVAASALSFATLAWAMPAGNRTYKEVTISMLPSQRAQGAITEPWTAHNEMSLSELRAQVAKFSSRGEPRRARQFAFYFHQRFALAWATLPLVGLLLAMRVNHPALRGALAFAACLIYWALIYGGENGMRRGILAPALAAWLPNLVLLASAFVFASSRSSRSSPLPSSLLRGPTRRAR